MPRIESGILSKGLRCTWGPERVDSWLKREDGPSSCNAGHAFAPPDVILASGLEGGPNSAPEELEKPRNGVLEEVGSIISECN